MQDESSDRIGQFVSTRWTLIDQAQHDTSTSRRAALDELLRVYLPALRAHLVLAKRIDRERANDLLQGFVAEKIIERDLIAQADPAKGRFRSFLLRSLENYVVDQIRHQKAQKRDAGPEVSLDSDRMQGVSPFTDDEESVYDVVWARQTFFEVLARMQAQCDARGTAHTWDVFECRIVEPLLRGTPPLSYQRLVSRLGLESPKQATNALATAKRQFDEALEFVVGQYVETEEELHEEIAHLRAALLKAASLQTSFSATESGASDDSVSDEDRLEGSSPEILAQMLDLSSDPNTRWSDDDLAAIWRHQGTLPLATLFSDQQWQDATDEFASTQESDSVTMQDLFANPRPPISLLQRLKQLAKQNARSAGEAFPADVAAALYFGSIAMALVCHEQRISRADDEVLRNGFSLMMRQIWLDDRAIDLFRCASAAVST